MHSIAELPTYIRLVNKLLSEDESRDLIDYLADHPQAGDIMAGTGSVRKLRWHRGGQGNGGVYVSSITTTMIICRYIYLRSSPKVISPT